MKLEKFDVSKEIKILKKWEEDSRKDRALRLQFVIQHDFKGQFLGDALLYFYYDEAKKAYVNGCLVSCIVMCQMAIERGIKAWYLDESLDKKGFFDLIKMAESENLLKPYEVKKLHKLRKDRNPYVHSHFGLEMKYFTKKKLSKNFDLEINEVEQNARESFKILMSFIKRTE